MTPLIALLALLQADTAEENFKKIEDTIDRAKTICVRLKWEAATRGDPDGKVQATGVILFKEGNRAFLRSTIQERGQSSELLIVSDGSVVRSKLGPKRLLECATPKNFNDGLRTALRRLGALQSQLIARRVCTLDEPEQEEALDQGKSMKLTDFEDGPEDGDLRTLTYKITPGGPESAVAIKLWYDPESYRLTKRTLTIKHPSDSVMTEVYKEFVLDSDLGNGEFRLPTAK